jgi:hypothetical protein
VQTASAIRAEVVCVIDIAQQRRFELGIFHAVTIARVACGALVDNSYSVWRGGLLYTGNEAQVTMQRALLW